MMVPLQYNRFEDLVYLGNGVEVIPWLHRRDARVLRAIEPITQSVSGSEPQARSAIGSEPQARSAIGSEPQARSAIGSEPQARSAIGSEPQARSAIGSEPQARSAIGSEPQARSAIGSEPQARSAIGSEPLAQSAISNKPPYPQPSIWSKAVQSHTWDRNDDFLDVYVTAQEISTRNDVNNCVNNCVNSPFLFIFPAAPHACDYIYASPSWFPDRQTIDTMYQTLQLRALRCITDRWVICDIFCLDGRARLGRTNGGDIRHISTMKRLDEDSRIEPILIGDLPYGDKKYRMELHHGWPVINGHGRPMTFGHTSMNAVRIPYGSRLEEMVSVAKKVIEEVLGANS